MPPHLALLLSFGLIFWLFRQDATERPVGSKQLWIPALWLLILSTRPIAYWVGSAQNLTGSTRELDGGGGPGGSPVDLAVLGLLIFGAIRILAHRRLDWGVFIRENRSILALYLFFLCSILWADYPFSLLKRIVKDFSVVLFSLVLLSELDVAYAIRKLFLRCSFIVFTLSVTTIKYFPDIGTNSTRAGDNMFTGLTTQKNTLGEVVFTYSIILLWDLIKFREENNAGWRHKGVLIRCLMLAMGLWLLLTCDSQTSLLCLILGATVYWASGRLLRFNRPKQKLVLAAGAALLLFALDSTFKIKEAVVEAMGRDLTFTGRTEIWEQVLAQPVNRLVGAGFLMFWDGEFGRTALDEMGVRISTAHNGYLEVFLDGGTIGALLLAIMLLGRGNLIIDRMIAGEYWGRLGFVYWSIALVYNFSETSFFRLGLLWFLLVFSMLKAPPAYGVPVVVNEEPAEDLKAATA